MRLIDADALTDYIKVWNVGEGIGDNHSEILKAVDRQPTIEAIPVVHGEWIFKNDGAYGQRRAYCSACGKRSGIGGIESNQRKPFCPNCGADMREGAIRFKIFKNE